MSNYLAIATVTAALQHVLQGPVGTAVNGAHVGFSRPDGKDAGEKRPLVNVYLYRVTPNAAYRNVDLPTRRGDGTLVKTPLTALDLHYLFTFRGSDEKLEPQRMLGAVASTLDAQPLLSAQSIQAAMTQFTFLAGSGLDSQIDRVRFTPTALTLEEFTKLWSAFFQVEYSLSAAYQASVVLIESGDTPQEALPVQARNIYVLPFEQPVITQVISKGGGPILPTSTLVIQGSHLLSDVTTVQIGDLVVSPTKVTDTTITLPVPTGVSAGVQPVQVVQQLRLGKPPKRHPGFDSNVAAMVLHPIITPGAATTTQITVNIVPAVQPAQRVTLLLNEATLPPPTPPAAYTFTLPPPTVSTGSLNFAITGVPAGSTKYFIRVAIDGAESLLDLDPTSLTYGPKVTIS
jgi:hypothetical protein